MHTTHIFSVSSWLPELEMLSDCVRLRPPLNCMFALSKIIMILSNFSNTNANEFNWQWQTDFPASALGKMDSYLQCNYDNNSADSWSIH
jgi:hypothetical protein